MTTGYETLIVTFSDPISVLDRMFYSETWGTGSLKEWLDGYESTRVTPINASDLNTLSLHDALPRSEEDRKSTRLNSSHHMKSRMPSSA